MDGQEKENKEKWIFALPKYLIFFESDIMYGLFGIIVILFPLILFFLLKSFFIIDGIFFAILVLIIGTYVIITGALLGVLHTILPDYVYRLQNYPIKKWISKNVKCPICGSDFSGSKPIRKKVTFFFEYMYVCRLCNKKFVTKPFSKYERKLEEYIKKIK